MPLVSNTHLKGLLASRWASLWLRKPRETNASPCGSRPRHAPIRDAIWGIPGFDEWRFGSKMLAAPQLRRSSAQF